MVANNQDTADSQDVIKKNLDIKLEICPLCKKELPNFRENGHYNFCPHILYDGKIVDVCITCKMNFHNS